MLATNKTTGVQAFYQVDGAGVKCAINKCYLTVPESDVKAFFFDETTGIRSIENETMRNGENEKYFDLSGRRIQKPTKGLYIVNGRKVVIK